MVLVVGKARQSLDQTLDRVLRATAPPPERSPGLASGARRA